MQLSFLANIVLGGHALSSESEVRPLGSEFSSDRTNLHQHMPDIVFVILSGGGKVVEGGDG